MPAEAGGQRKGGLVSLVSPAPCLARVAPLPPRMAPAAGGGTRRRQDPPLVLPLLLLPGRAVPEVAEMLPGMSRPGFCSAPRGRAPLLGLPGQMPLLNLFLL